MTGDDVVGRGSFEQDRGFRGARERRRGVRYVRDEMKLLVLGVTAGGGRDLSIRRSDGRDLILAFIRGLATRVIE